MQHKKAIKFFLLSMVVLTLSLVLGACSFFEGKPQDVIKIYSDGNDMERAKEEDVTVDGGPSSVKIAIASVVSPRESISKYLLLLKHLEEKLGRPIDIYQKQTYAEVNDMLARGDVDFAFICSLSYVIGKEKGEMIDIAAVEVDGSSYYQSYIISREDRPFESIEDLKGKRFAYTDPLSFTGRLAVLEMLYQRGLVAEKFFGETFFTHSHDNSIKAVAMGLADAAAVDSILFDFLVKADNDIISTLKIIERGEFAGTPPIVASHHTDPELVDTFKDIILSLHEDKAGKRILDDIGIDRYVMMDEEDYQIIKNSLDLLGAGYEENPNNN